jgi:hypothetical protein
MVHRHRRTALIALALYSAVLAVLFQEPIRRGIGISPYDLTYRFSNFAYLEPGLHPSNDTLVDQPLQFEIWHEYARREIRAGRIPWTNPYQGGGLPLVGNFQSALFYPSQILYYLLPRNFASVLSAFLRLLCAAMGTFCLLRVLHVSRGVSWIGGMAFALGGFNIVWLGHPHTNCSILLPWILLLVYKIACFEVRWQNYAWLTALITLLFFGGHPGTIFHVLFAAAWFGGYFFFRRRTGRIRCAALTLASLCLAVALASVQLVPFFLYLRQSAAAQLRNQEGATPSSSPRVVLSWLVPKVFGSPRDGTEQISWAKFHFPSFFSGLDVWASTRVNFNESVGGYVGSVFLLLMPIAFLRPGRRRWVYWIGGLMLISLLLGCSIEPVVWLFNHVPGFAVVNNTRMQLIWGMFTVILGAFGLDYILGMRSRLSPVISTSLFTAGLVIAGALALGYFVFQSAAGRGPASLFPSHEGLKQVSFLMLRLGVLSVAASLFWRWRIGAAAMVAIVALLVGSEAMSYAMNYNPAFDLDRRYPVTPGIRFLQSHAGANWTLFLGDVLFPDMPTIYGIRDLRSYDAMERQSFREVLVRRLHIDPTLDQVNWVPDSMSIHAVEEELHLQIAYVAVHAPGKLAEGARSEYRGELQYQGPDFVIYSVPHGQVKQ